jgi:hypothetical protein
MSKTYNNYIKARERMENSLKEKIEKLNKGALMRIKNEREAKKVAKELKQIQAEKQEK